MWTTCSRVSETPPFQKSSTWPRFTSSEPHLVGAEQVKHCELTYPRRKKKTGIDPNKARSFQVPALWRTQRPRCQCVKHEAHEKFPPLSSSRSVLDSKRGAPSLRIWRRAPATSAAQITKRWQQQLKGTWRV